MTDQREEAQPGGRRSQPYLQEHPAKNQQNKKPHQHSRKIML